MTGLWLGHGVWADMYYIVLYCIVSIRICVYAYIRWRALFVLGDGRRIYARTCMYVIDVLSAPLSGHPGLDEWGAAAAVDRLDAATDEG